MLAREAFRLVWQLQAVYPDRPEAVAYDRALVPLVDALSVSAADVDQAYYLLEEMHKEVSRWPPGQDEQRAAIASRLHLLCTSFSARV